MWNIFLSKIYPLSLFRCWALLIIFFVLSVSIIVFGPIWATIGILLMILAFLITPLLIPVWREFLEIILEND